MAQDDYPPEPARWQAFQRIESAAENRDAGSPQIVSDSARMNSGWGWNGTNDGGMV